MWAIITNDNQVVAKDFKSKPAALGFMKHFLIPNVKYEIINQNRKNDIFLKKSDICTNICTKRTKSVLQICVIFWF